MFFVKGKPAITGSRVFTGFPFTKNILWGLAVRAPPPKPLPVLLFLLLKRKLRGRKVVGGDFPAGALVTFLWLG
jgi:hypothetical protein